MHDSLTSDKPIALVTGASRGIGAAVAEALAAQGAHVIAVARTQGALEELDDRIAEAGGSCTLLPMDLTKFADLDKIGPSIYERFGRLDIVIGNAGTLGPLTPAHQIEHKDLERVMRLNLTANVRLMKSVDPVLRAAPQGRAIFITSAMAELQYAYFGAYAASKAALNAFIGCYAAELSQTNMRVRCFSPGMVNTEMARGIYPGGYPEGLNVIEPAEAAQTILKHLNEMG